MTKTATKKVCIVVLSLAKGGAERSAAILTKLLEDIGFEVYVVSILDEIEYDYNGHLLNLGKLKNTDDSFLGRIHRYQVFRNYLKSHSFDYVIDNRTRIGLIKEIILSRFTYKPAKTIYCVRSYKLINYMSSNRFFTRLMYGDAFKIVAVSKEIAVAIRSTYGLNNISVIHNPIEIAPSQDNRSQADQNEKYILYYGRLVDKIKNISLLLEAYAASSLPRQNIRLKIMGDGEDAAFLMKKCKDLELQHKIDFLAFQANPYDMVKSAFLTVLTSRYEGFPRVLLESLALGTPVISVNCKSGPSEIIEDESNGLLVENYNKTALSQAMDRMVEDEELYLNCKRNAIASVERFSVKSIANQWRTLLEK